MKLFIITSSSVSKLFIIQFKKLAVKVKKKCAYTKEDSTFFYVSWMFKHLSAIQTVLSVVSEYKEDLMQKQRIR